MKGLSPPLLLLSRSSRVRLRATPDTAAHQAPRPWILRQEHWNGLPCPSPPPPLVLQLFFSASVELVSLSFSLFICCINELMEFYLLSRYCILGLNPPGSQR